MPLQRQGVDCAQKRKNCQLPDVRPNQKVRGAATLIGPEKRIEYRREQRLYAIDDVG
jgi:hypothetical protein